MIDLKELLLHWKECPEQPKRIITFGSSNTELCWLSAGRHNWVDWFSCNIRDRVGRHITTINTGICGDTSAMLLKRIDRDVFSFNPSLVIITIGGNDAGKNLPQEKYYSNLKNICLDISNKNAIPVLQTYYCPYYQETDGGFESVFDGFMETNRKLSRELDIPLIDQYSYFEPLYRNDSQSYAYLMRDFLHVSPIGNLIMGIIISRHFGLMDPVIPEDLIEDVEKYLGIIENYNMLPESIF